jgi:hypothetical protein
MSSMYPEDDVTTQQTATPEAQTSVESFLADLMAERIENWRDAAVAQYPSVASLREYLTANTKAETMALAEDLATKLGAGEAPSSPSVTGGSPAITRHPGDDTHYGIEEAQADIRQGRDREAVFGDYLTQKFHDNGQLAPWEQQ